MFKLLQHTICAGAVLLAATTAQAVTVVNGDFEQGDFAGWSLIEDQGLNVVDMGAPHGGDYAAFFGETGAPASITQQLSTQAGQAYSVSFWLSNLGSGSANSTTNTFQMLIDGNALIAVNDKSATNYTQYQMTFTAASSATSLAFRFQHDDSFWLLDDVAVNLAPGTIPAIPEPSSVLMLLLGMGALATRHYLRTNR